MSATTGVIGERARAITDRLKQHRAERLASKPERVQLRLAAEAQHFKHKRRDQGPGGQTG